jgi:hypothetical protein
MNRTLLAPALLSGFFLAGMPCPALAGEDLLSALTPRTYRWKSGEAEVRPVSAGEVSLKGDFKIEPDRMRVFQFTSQPLEA